VPHSRIYVLAKGPEGLDEMLFRIQDVADPYPSYRRKRLCGQSQSQGSFRKSHLLAGTVRYLMTGREEACLGQITDI
jgi:hypothetical protein